jgi:hypothetical protein
VFILTAFALLALCSLIRRFGLVHVHNMPDLRMFTALVPKALGAKVVLDLHDPMLELMMTIFGKRSRGEPLASRITLSTTRYSILNWEMRRILPGASLASSTTLTTR